MKRTNLLNIFNFLSHMRLLDSVVLVIVLLIIIILILVGLVFSNQLYDVIHIQKEKVAVETAKNMADLPSLTSMITEAGKHRQLQTLIVKFRRNTESSFIAVTDHRGVVLAHSQGGQKGTTLNNPYIRLALEEGNAYVYRHKEESKPYISGTAPVTGSAGQVVGLVSVGYAVEQIRFVSQSYLEKMVFYIFVLMIFGLGASVIIARGVKNAIFGLEPSEIASLFQTRNAIIESIRSGVLATDKDGTIILTNSNAEDLLTRHHQPMVGQPVTVLFPSQLVNRALKEGVSVYDAEAIVQGITMRCNIVPLHLKQQIEGVVATFRKKDEIDMITGELGQVTRYSELLRAQTHEYTNRLHTIAGMIQTEDYDSVLEIIAAETTEQKLIVRLLMEIVDDTAIRSLLLGKHMHAKELKIDFRIDPESSLKKIPPHISRHQLITILGNLIDNAFEATMRTDAPHRVFLSLSDFGDLIFEIEDSGPGIPPGMNDRIFERGSTTKKDPGHGVGLYLVHQALLGMNGFVSIVDSELGGARFIVTIYTLQEEENDAS